tara:strand:- start:386 stop:1090 length:705 start_codon:yes stop_codon:yes gene_type:complete
MAKESKKCELEKMKMELRNKSYPRKNLWDEYASVDENGVSKVILAEDIIKEFKKNTKFKTLYWKDEGPTRHGCFRNIIQYKWNNVKKGGKFISFQSIGINENYANSELRKNRPICNNIRKNLEKKYDYCALCCEKFGPKDKKIPDHKDDSYSNPRVCGKNSKLTQKASDFQLVCEACNRYKDLIKQKYKEWRPPPAHYLKMGFLDHWIDNKGNKKEYWEDAEAYREYNKKLFSK